MAYERSPFGYNTSVLSDVSNHYGPRVTGGERGTTNTDGAEREVTVNFDSSGPIYDEVFVPAGAVVVEVLGLGLTGAIATAVVGATDISGADGTAVNYVPIATTGLLDITGPTAGTVIVKYTKLA